MRSHSYFSLLAPFLIFGVIGCEHHLSSPTQNGQHAQLVYELLSGGINLINDDASGKQWLSGGVGPKWSPNGDQIAFFENDGTHGGVFLCTIEINGSNFRQLTLAVREGETLTSSLDWSPDGSQLVFFTTKYHSSGFAVINADGTNERNLTPQGYWLAAHWSPDGTLIAFDGAPVGGPQPSIYMINPDGTGLYNLIDAFAVGPSWRPDGKKIAFTIGTKSDTLQRFRFNTYVCNRDGSDLQQLTYNGEVRAGWFPDGSKMFYLFHPKEIANPGLASLGLMKADGSDPKVLLPADEHHGILYPSFSADGSKIAYVRISGASPEELWVMNADGSQQRKLDSETEGGSIPAYDWSPR